MNTSSQFVSAFISVFTLASCSGGPGSGYFSDSVSSSSDRSQVSGISDELSTNQKDREESEDDPGFSDYPDSGNVQAPQMITGSYLVKCEADAENENAVDCQIENNSEFITGSGNLDTSSIRWIVTDAMGRELASHEFRLNTPDPTNPWKVKIEVLTGREFMVNLAGSGQGDQSLSSAIEVTPFKKDKAPSQTAEGTDPAPAATSPSGSQSSEPDSPVFPPIAGNGESLLPQNVVFSDSFVDNPLTKETDIIWDTWGRTDFLDFSDTSFRCSIPENNPEYAGISSRSQFNFNDAFLSVTLVEAYAPDEGMEPALFGINAGNGNDVFFFVEAGKLYVRQKTAWIRSNLISVPYIPDQHRHLAFHHYQQRSVIEFMTSPDGKTWTTFATTFVPWPVSNVRFELQCGTWKNTLYTSAIFDDIVLKQ